MNKRLLSLILVFCMVVSLFPAQALAAGDDSSQKKQTTKTDNPFTDVMEGDWYYNAVEYARENGFFSGTSATTFDPDGTMTRGMFVTVLGRMAGVDPTEYSGESEFSDVPQNQYYAPYVTWAAKYGVTSGTGDGKFSPDEKITRQQMAAFFVRYFEAFDVDYDTGANITTVPADIDTVDEYAREAVLKLWKTGLLNGDGINFNPKGNATRAQAATLCMRTDETVETWYKEPGVPSKRVRIDPNEEQKPPEEQKPTPGNNGGGTITTYYEVEFALGSGESSAGVTLPEKGTYQAGTSIGNLPTPFKSNAIFLGWYYDEAMTQGAQSTDMVIKNMTLYADMADGTPVSEGGSPNYVSSVDQRADFKIRLSDSADISDIKVLKISGGNEDVTASVTVSGGIVSGNWEAGQTYRLEVLDDSVLIYYNDVEQDAAVRLYNFTTQKEEILNLGLNKGLMYIPSSSVSNMTGKAFDGLFGITVRQSRSTVQENSATGSFTYTDAVLNVGDTVAIYSGTRPDLRDLSTAEGDGDVAYVTVTAVDGSTYTYISADSKDVLFTPDVLPVSVDADTDGSSDNYSISVAASVLDFSDDMYADLGLDATTTVDVGDFIAFYSGTFGEQDAKDAGYFRITAVIPGEETYTLTYTDATQTDIMTAMDIYDSREIEGEKLLEDVDVAALEAKMSSQALESGFVEEATQYLAALALETDGFNELREDMNLQSVSFYLDDGSAASEAGIQLMAAPKVKIEEKETDVRITTRLEHFTDNSTGLRAELSLSFKLVVNPDSDNQIHITVVAIFEQEVLLGLNVSGGAIWKWAWIFPYIYDYRLNANIDVGTFTGIGITATAVTKSAEDEFDWKTPTGNSASQKIVDIGRQIKALMDEKDEFFGESAGSNGGGLAEKYAAMLSNESDWVELFSVDLFSSEGSVDPFHILCYGINVDFVVSANMNITIGMTFEYGNAKRYNFSLLLFHKQSSNETIDLETEHYQFDFYVMGTIGIRAGIRLEVAVGLFSLKLASIGISAEVGAYAQLWGYFYYSLRWEKGEGKQSQFSGAMLVEIGIYLEIKFLAQAFSGTFAYNPTLYYNEWPLWSVGERNNVYDFAYSQNEVPTFNMVGITKTLAIPSTIYKMSWMNLRTGGTDTAIYGPERFEITFSNPAFTYDAGNQRIVCTPAANSIEESAEMRVAWGGSPLAFTSTPIERVFKVKWSDPKNAKYITFDTGGGSVIGAIVGGAGAEIQLPTPTKQGYVFDGWYYRRNGIELWYNETTIPKDNLELYAKWLPATNTVYTEEHYIEELNGSYSLYNSSTRRGTTGSRVVVTKEPISERDKISGYTYNTAPYITHFTYDENTTILKGNRVGTIAPDGSMVLKLYYKRNSYTATFTYGEHASAENQPFTVTKPYGSKIYAPQLALGGYLFKDFGTGIGAGGELTLTGNVTYGARWDPDPNTPYRVEHYIQTVDGDSYLRLGGENGIISSFGTTGKPIPVADHKLTTPGLALSHATVNGKTVTSPTIGADGNTVLKLYYNRVKYLLYWNATGTANGTVSGGDSGYVPYGKLITQPVVAPKPGYLFDGWYTDSTYQNKAELNAKTAMPAQNFYYYGRFVPHTDTAYKVEHYQQNANDNGYTKVETDELTDVTDVTVTAQAKSYANFTENTTHAGRKASGKVAGDGSLVLKLYYDRDIHSAVFDTAGGSTIDSVSYRYGKTIATPTAPTRKGYTFTGWTWDGQTSPVKSFSAVLMGASDITFTANWSAITYTINYDLKGGSPTVGSSNPVEYNIETADITLISPLKTGYTFTGWTWDGQSLPQKTVTLPVGSTGNRSYTANWTANTYTVSFNAGEGSVVPAGKSVTYDSTYGELPVPSRTGYTFAGWFTQVDGETQISSDTKVETAADQTLYARWTIKRLSISFDTKGGSSIATITQDYGTAILKPANPTRTGYTFVGWDKVIPATMPEVSLTITARWSANTYTVSFNAGEGSVTPASKSVTYDSTYGALPEPTRVGYTFTGWFTAALGGTKVSAETKVAITAPQTLYARWGYATDTAYTVEYYQQNANDEGYTKVTADTLKLTGTTNATATAPEKSYSGFMENTTHKDSLISAAIAAEGTLVLKRYYDRSTFTITFDKNDPDATIVSGSASQTLRYGQTIVAPTLTCIDKNFLGWYENAEGTGEQIILSTMTLGDVRLYAKWAFGEASYTVNHYVMETDGTYSMTPTKTQGKTDTISTPLTLADLKDSGYLIENGIEYSHGEVSGSSTENAVVRQGLVVNLYYKRCEYTLTWDLGGVTPTNSDYTRGTVYYGTAIILPVISKTGYTYQWSTAPAATMPAQHVSYTANWIRSTITVTFNPMGGTVTPSTKKVTCGETYGELPTPTLTGYNFKGWYTDDKFVTKVESTSKVTSEVNHTLYAKWELGSFTVYFMGPFGVIYHATRQQYGTAIIPPADPVRPGYRFDGWDKSVPVTMPGEDYFLVAQWTALEVNYTVEYIIENPYGDYETTSEVLRAKTDSTIYLGDPRASTVYELVKDQSTTSAKIAGDGSTVLKLVYRRKLYKATFDAPWPSVFEAAGLNGAAYTGDTKHFVWKNVPAGGDLAVYAPIPTYLGHTLGKWKRNGNETDVALDKEAYYEAQWVPNMYTITFNGNGHTGGDMPSMTYTYKVENQQTPANAFTRTGYDFLRWNTKEDGTGKAYSDQFVVETWMTENITLYAQWRLKTRTVTFNANGGSGYMSSQQVTYFQEAKPLTLNTIKRNYHTFMGWNTKADGTGTAYADGQLISNLEENITLYAQWKSAEATLTFETGDGGTIIDPITQDYGTAVTPPANPTRSGYVFRGWNATIPSTMPLNNMTFTAKWAPVFSLNLDGGTAPEGVTYPTYYNPADTAGSGGIYVENKIPSHPSGITFNGWVWAGEGTLPSGVTISGAQITLSQGVDVPLYFKAQWKVKLKLTFSVSTLDGVTSGEEREWIAGAPLPVLEKENWIFKGWNHSGTIITTVPYANVTDLNSLTDAWAQCEVYSANAEDFTAAMGICDLVLLREDITLTDGTGRDATNVNGNGYTITLSTATKPLFDTVKSKSTVENLTVNADITSVTARGILANKNEGTLINCNAKGSLQSNSSYYYAGGLVGGNTGIIQNCKNYADVNSVYGAGGITGYVSTGGIVDSCENYGAIKGLSAGGIAASIDGFYGSATKTYTTLLSCSNYGTVEGTGTNGYTGGIVAVVSKNGIVDGCRNLGGSVAGVNKVGGVVGSNGSNGIKNCINKVEVTGETYVGGICGHSLGTYSSSQGTYVVEILNCSNEGTVRGKTMVGGICGSSEIYASVSNCINEGMVNGETKVGGICGDAVNITDSTNKGAVKGVNTVGGVCGYNSNLRDCINEGDVTGENDVGGICGEAIVITKSSNKGAVTGKWDVGGVVGYISSSVNHSSNSGTVTSTVAGGTWGTIAGRAEYKSSLNECSGDNPQVGFYNH